MRRPFFAASCAASAWKGACDGTLNIQPRGRAPACLAARPEPRAAARVLPASTAGIVDKTAEFVARNGDKFVGRILASNKGNVKFNFLKEQDAYHGGQPASSSRPPTHAPAQRAPAHRAPGSAGPAKRP